MRDRNEPAPPVQMRVQPIEIEPALGRHRQEAQHQAFAFGELLPRHQIAVVLKMGEQNFVATRQKAPE
jgi:hypothetical protein